MQADLVHRLRSRSYSFKIPDPLVEEAADEIERLRLTGDEIDAVEQAAREAEAHCHCEQAETLRSLLDRVMTTEQVRARIGAIGHQDGSGQ